MDGVVVIGEGEKDEAPMLYNGEQIGDGTPPRGRHRGRPARGHALTALGMPSALAVIALAERGTMFDPGPVRLHGEDRRRPRDRRPARPRPAAAPRRSSCVAERKGTDVRDVMVVVLDRPRHEEAIDEIREAGARVRLILDGDVSAALLAVTDDAAVDLLWGIGGTPEGVHLGGRDQVHRRPAARAACGRATTTSARPRIDAGYDLDAGAHRRRPRRRRRRVLLGDRRDRRRRAPGRALPGRRAARRPSRWSCARARAPCGASRRATTAPSCAALTGGRYG